MVNVFIDPMFVMVDGIVMTVVTKMTVLREVGFYFFGVFCFTRRLLLRFVSRICEYVADNEVAHLTSNLLVRCW